MKVMYRDDKDEVEWSLIKGNVISFVVIRPAVFN